ncbi:MAG: peptidase [Candidatus Nitronauta litoralis]|uniref:Peptidase n=1 Tax=Candidatus Nitronauta litoralis TaxID=2705533 RepID=A0A7T0G1G8_9BACT|nr:MAG: peptidase [Candidatus Nitronauta litoralis]
MTFCVAMKIESGIVAISDSRITSGTEQTLARKVTVHQKENHSLFLMTSGLRSVRDKALTYFEEALCETDEKFEKLYKAVNHFTEQIRKVAEEDKPAIEDSGLSFNLHSIIGGQLEKDDEHKLYLVYPQGNWIEVTQETPYQIIGEGSYGKPILDLGLCYASSPITALKVGFLAFDATRRSATDVGFPIDVVYYPKDSYKIIEYQYEKNDLEEVCAWWRERLRSSLEELPASWTNNVLAPFNTIPGR